jgi:hypothetical protein
MYMTESPATSKLDSTKLEGELDVVRFGCPAVGMETTTSLSIEYRTEYPDFNLAIGVPLITEELLPVLNGLSR